jgi:hypothetical protein
MPINRLWPLFIIGFLLASILYAAEAWGWIEPTNIRLIGFALVIMVMTVVDAVLNGMGYQAGLLEPTDAPPLAQWFALIFVLVALILTVWIICRAISAIDAKFRNHLQMKKDQDSQLLKMF